LTLVARLRQAGFAAEAFVMGSPRKRYDKARIAEPAILLSLDIRDGQPTQAMKVLDETFAGKQEVLKIFGSKTHAVGWRHIGGNGD
jgi:histidyl-tRNA synthetase